MDRHFSAGAVRPASPRPHQRILLCAVEPRPRGDLRHAQHHQFRAWRPLHDGRLLRLFPAQRIRARLLVGARPRAAHHRHFRHGHRAHHAATDRPPRPSLRPAAHLRSRPRHPGPIPELFRLFGPALCNSPRIERRPESRLHVPAELSRLGHRLLARRLSCDLVHDRAHAARCLL